MMMISYEYGNVGLSVASRKVKCKFRPWLEDSEDGAGYRNLTTELTAHLHNDADTRHIMGRGRGP